MFFSIILLSVTLSIDALFAGFSYGLSKTKIPLGSKLIICAFSVIYSALAVLIGGALANVLSPLIGKIIGSFILALLGVFMIFKPESKKKNVHKEDEGPKTLFKIIFKSFGITIEVLKNNVEEADVDGSGTIDKKEAVLLGFALSVDSLGAGIGFALSGISSFYIPFCVGLFQLLFLSVGLYSGFLCVKRRSQTKKTEKITKILPGSLLLVLAAVRLF